MPDSQTAIEVHNLSKRYRLGMFGARTFWHEMKQLLRGRPGNRQNEFWALQDVNFTVNRGELVGIIGSNGAGKSTLLKILSRITGPTTGDVLLHGRTSSLLEVGTGFHPDLSGRDNVFLNGTILGMKKREIQARFEEIVDFANLHEFIDTPVKRYSSGMYVRLAFAVAAHLEPEILIVDEVLAVGDYQFQKKCMDKMRSVAESGRTVLFVSHNTSVVENLCRRLIWLKAGQVIEDGPAQQVMSRYLTDFSSQEDDVQAVSSDGQVMIRSFRLINSQGQTVSSIVEGESLTAEFQVTAKQLLQQPFFSVFIGHDDYAYFGASQILDGFSSGDLKGTITVRCHFPEMRLLPKRSYFVGLTIRAGMPPKPVLRGVREDFHVTEDPQTCRQGQHRDAYYSGCPPVTLPYQWEIDGQLSKVYDNVQAPLKNPAT